jgi:thiol-disulfide isomerase/thioredoxin
MKRTQNQSLLGALLAVLLAACLLQPLAYAGGWSLQDKDGVRYTLAGLHGRWVLVNFWAPWCPPCLEEMPDFAALQQQHKDLQVIGVAVMYRSREKVTEALGKLSISYPIVYGNEDTAADFGGLDGLPTSFLYSPSGELVGHHQGILTKADIEHAMAQQPGAAALFIR